jgi:hypothetical protein
MQNVNWLTFWLIWFRLINYLNKLCDRHIVIDHADALTTNGPVIFRDNGHTSAQCALRSAHVNKHRLQGHDKSIELERV